MRFEHKEECISVDWFLNEMHDITRIIYGFDRKFKFVAKKRIGLHFAKILIQKSECFCIPRILEIEINEINNNISFIPSLIKIYSL